MSGKPILTQLRELHAEDSGERGENETWMPLRASEGAKILEALDLLAEAYEKLPGWAGADDAAHGWWVRARRVLAEARGA
jgi:hypothetical protein